MDFPRIKCGVNPSHNKPSLGRVNPRCRRLLTDVTQPRHHLAREQLHALDSQVVRQRAELRHCDEFSETHLLLIGLELLGDRVGSTIVELPAAGPARILSVTDAIEASDR